MAKHVDEKLQDSSYLKEAVQKYKTEMAEVGADDELAADFDARIQNVTLKDTAHKEAGNLIRQKTAEQQTAIRESVGAIRIVKEAAKDVFYGKSEIIDEFHPGLQVNTVKAALTELPYFIELTTRRLDDLSKAGIGQANLDELNRCYTQIRTVDSEQENAKRVRTAAYNEREAALKSLQELMYRIRRKADIRFADNPDIRNEFRTIIRRRKSSATENPPTTEE